jgi:hypothetical protein
MIAPGANARVYLACGVTDMRKGITGLAAKAQEELRQNAASGALFAFRGGAAAIGSNFCIGMGRAFAFITRFWRRAVFHGRRLPTDPRVSQRRNSRCCGRASTGAVPRGARRLHAL